MAANPTSAAKRDSAEWPHAAHVECWNCHVDREGQLFCPACNALQPFPEHADYFDVMGLPRTPVVDTVLLQRRYYELHRKLHPDLFQTGAPEARQASLRNTAAVNQAFRTLRDREDRGLYWLTLQGESLGSNNNRVPPELAALVFEVQEKLEELRDGNSGARSEVSAIRDTLESQRSALLDQLDANYAQWDRTPGATTRLAGELKAILSRLAYLNTLIRDVDHALEH